MISGVCSGRVYGIAGETGDNAPAVWPVSKQNIRSVLIQQ
jgi:hypothetical protein